MTADKLNITRCSETGKGVEASEDIEIGEIVLEVPDFLIIDENTVKKSETYKTLMGKDISSEEMLLLWCMMERRNPGPKFKVYFESLPHKFYTGLSFGKNAEREIGGTYLGCELQEILKHLSKRFRDLCSKIIIPSEYKLEDYMWACQLLDTNGMRILASDGTSRICLVPVAGFFNHSKPYVREVLEKLLCGLLDLGWEYQDVWRCDDDESDSFEPPLIWKSDGTCVIDVDNEIMTKPYHRKQEYEWDMKLVRRYKFVMRSLVISAVRSCENTLKKL